MTTTWPKAILRIRAMAGAVLGVALLATLCACPPDDKKSPAPAALQACTKVGQSCEFSPGKLGTCVQKDECATAAACFVCQSQH